MSKHILRAVALAAALLPAWAVAAPLSIDQAMDLAVQRSEATRAARASVASARETARASGQLPDPILRAGVENLPITGLDRFSTTRDFQTMKRIGIAQEWVSSEKRAAREAAAQTTVSRESALVQVAAADVRLQTVLAYLDAYYAGEALKLTSLNEKHAREELEAGRGRLATTSGNSTEVLALMTSLGMAEDESGDLRQQQSAARVALRRWVGLEADELAAPGLAGVPTEARYVATHPSVVAKQRDIEVARREVEVARLNRKPNSTWEVSYGQRTGYADMVSFGVIIPLTVAPEARQDRETAAKLALVEKSEAELAEAQRAVQGEYAALMSDVKRLQERIERFRAGVIVPAQQRTATTTTAYRSNQASLVMLFEARHAEVELQRKLLTLQRDLAKTQAQLTFKPVAGGAQ
jgi:cobalt-zinc-cadmium efflux system outer membrane protein